MLSSAFVRTCRILPRASVRPLTRLRAIGRFESSTTEKTLSHHNYVTLIEFSTKPNEGRHRKIATICFGIVAGLMILLTGYERLVMEDEDLDEDEDESAQATESLKDRRAQMDGASKERRAVQTVADNKAASNGGTALSEKYEVSSTPPKALQEILEARAHGKAVQEETDKGTQRRPFMWKILYLFPTAPDVLPALRRGMEEEGSLALVCISLIGLWYLFTQSRRLSSLHYCTTTKKLLLTRHKTFGGISKARVIDPGQLVQILDRQRPPSQGSARVLYLLDSVSYYTFVPSLSHAHNHEKLDELLPDRPPSTFTVSKILLNLIRGKMKKASQGPNNK